MQPPERAIGPGDGGTRSGDDTSEMHEPGGRKTRDIFPLPLLLEPSDGLAVGCRKTMRRKQHQRHLVEETNRTIQALNLMFCGSGDRKRHFSLDSHLFGEASAQWDSLEFIEEMVKRMGKPPPDMTCQGALSMLRAAGGYTRMTNPWVRWPRMIPKASRFLNLDGSRLIWLSCGGPTGDAWSTSLLEPKSCHLRRPE